MPTLLRQIRRLTEQHPDLVALAFNGQSYTYSALLEAVDRLRSSLQERGVKRGDKVAVMLPNCPHFIISHLAIMGIGAISIPMNALQKSREIEWQTEDSEISALISWSNLTTETERAAMHSESLRLRVYLGDNIPDGAENLVDLIANGDHKADPTDCDDDDEAAIVYTSGASGHARGVELTHANFAAHAAELGRLLRIRDVDRFLTTLPFTSIAGLTAGIHLPLFHGSTIQVQSRFHPGDVLQTIHGDLTTVFIGNPSAFAMMARFPSPEKYNVSRLRYAISCEARLPEETARMVEENLHLRIFDAYGTTETCGIATVNIFPQMLPRGSVGQPIGGHEVCIFGDNGEILPPDQVGQVSVRGTAVAKGYHNRPDKTKLSFRDGWFLTSDQGCLDEQSNLFITAHSDEIIFKGGFPVHCREIEEIVEGLPHVHEVAVVGIADPILGEEIKACVVLKEGAVIGPTEIIEYVKERIALYKCPKFVKLVKELPRTPSGKIIRSLLKSD